MEAAFDLGAATNDVEHDPLAQRGIARYKEIKPLLEPEFNNQYVAIHADTGEYAVERSSGNAMRAMRLRQPEGPLVIRRIGPEPEWGLAARLLASQMASGQRK